MRHECEVWQEPDLRIGEANGIRSHPSISLSHQDKKDLRDMSNLLITH